MESLYVDTSAELVRLVEDLRAASWLALDTEFLRETSYYPKLCLVQIGTPELLACVDPLAIADLGPLMELLYRPSLCKVLHACGQDLEIFAHLESRIPTPVFDTQVAAAFCGIGSQIGYVGLVEELLGIRLPKSHTQSDWSRRPLSPEQLAYAEDDVRYLVELYPRLAARVAEAGRDAWLEEDLEAVGAPERYLVDPASAWLRIKGTGRLRGPELAVCQALAAWRERTAQEEDTPRGWLLSDAGVLAVARAQPRDERALSRLDGIRHRFVRRHGASLVRVVRDARERPAEPLPADRQARRLTDREDASFEALQDAVRRRSAELGLDASLLATRRDLTRLARGEPFHDVVRGWRAGVLERELVPLLGT